jgi:hypothetical protein
MILEVLMNGILTALVKTTRSVCKGQSSEWYIIEPDSENANKSL